MPGKTLEFAQRTQVRWTLERRLARFGFVGCFHLPPGKGNDLGAENLSPETGYAEVLALGLEEANVPMR